MRDPGARVRLHPPGHPPRDVAWGHSWQVGTPAYWIALTHESRVHGTHDGETTRHRLGADLAEEIAACLLGGHGIPHHVGLAAFEAVKSSGALRAAATRHDIEVALSEPLRIDARTVRYRFAVQRSAYLAEALARLREDPPPTDALNLRQWLLNCRGIGPKTASWIVRNHLGSNDVAIIDIHVLRAGISAGVFAAHATAARHYDLLEALFLEWAHHGSVDPADLDSVIWSERARRPAVYAMLHGGDRITDAMTT
ncbi:hypothetical protein A7G45_08735 [Mycolicibacterium llatzerense]|nr:hypothetical protein [Mycolicibacterium llatzerense]